MLKRIDELGRIVIPQSLRKEIGVDKDEYVEVKRKENEIVISKMSNMLSEEAITHLYKTWEKEKSDSDYDRGFGDALKVIIGKGN